MNPLSVHYNIQAEQAYEEYKAEKPLALGVGSVLTAAMGVAVWGATLPYMHGCTEMFVGIGVAATAGLAWVGGGLFLKRANHKALLACSEYYEENVLLRGSSKGDQCNELLRMGKAPAKGNYATLLSAYGAEEIAPVGLIAQKYLSENDSIEISVSA